MKVNKLDLILKKLDSVEAKLSEHDKRFDNIESDITKIKNCPTIQKELGE